MSKLERELVKSWVATWKNASSDLELARKNDIRASNTWEAIQSFGLSFSWAKRQNLPKGTSGLVEQQRLFVKLRDR